MVISNEQHPNGSSMNYTVSSGSYHALNGGMVNPSNIPSTLSTIPHASNSLQCCLVENGIKCTRPSGNASYSKRIEKQVQQRKLRLIVAPHASHTYICEHHKQIIQSHRTGGKRKRKDEDYSVDDDLIINDFHPNDSSNDLMSHAMGLNASSSYKSYNIPASPYDIDLHSLQVNTLRRYKRYYRIATKPGLNKTQLAEEMSRHFRTIPVYPEKEIVNHFVYTIKSNTNKLDFNQSKES